jgi:hypothetical protein
MASSMKAMVSVTVMSLASYLLAKRVDNGHAPEVAMWLLGALMGLLGSGEIGRAGRYSGFNVERRPRHETAP